MYLSRYILPIALVGLSIGLSGCHWEGYSFTYTGIERTKSTVGTFPSGVTQIVVSNKYGDVVILQADVQSESEPGYQWTGKTWSETDEMAEVFQTELVLNESKTNGVLTLKLQYPESHEDLNGIKSHLTLRVPMGMAVQSVNSHGDSKLVGVSGKVTSTNSHGDTFVANMPNQCSVTNSHGDLMAENVKGIKATVNHGNIRLTNAMFETKVKSSHASVILANVQDVVVNSTHSDIEVQNASGNVSISTTHDRIRLFNITGDLDLENGHGRISGTGINGSVKAINEHADIELSGTMNKVQLENEHAQTELTLTDSEFGSIDIESAHGNVVVRLPEEAKISYEIDASSSNCDFEFVEDGNSVQIEADHAKASILKLNRSE